MKYKEVTIINIDFHLIDKNLELKIQQHISCQFSMFIDFIQCIFFSEFGRNLWQWNSKSRDMEFPKKSFWKFSSIDKYLDKSDFFSFDYWNRSYWILADQWNLILACVLFSIIECTWWIVINYGFSKYAASRDYI